MPSHLSSIGFVAASKEDFMAVVQQAASKGRLIHARTAEYCLWEPGGGPELWVQLQITQQGQRTLLGFNPHFRGLARMRFGATGATASSEYPLEGNLEGWADPVDEKPESGVFPISLAVPDFELSVAGLTFPRNLDIQVAAFAHKLTCFPDEEAFEREGPKMIGDRGMAKKSLIPMGSFEGQQPSTAIFCGEIMGAELKVNPAAGGRYHHLFVETLGGQVDVVADPSVLVGEASVGGIVQYEGWLSARLA